MIVLDTNVLSALIEEPANATVIAWLNKQGRKVVWITSITLFESRWGLDLMEEGARRTALHEALDRVVSKRLEGRILPFEHEAAKKAAALMANRAKAGKPLEFRDGMIAGVVLAKKGTLATRNTKHFNGTGVKLVDPWTD